MPSSHPILCRPLLLLPPIPPSIRVFSNESTLCMRWPKYWSFSFSINPSNEHSGLISFRMDWLDLLAVQGTLKSLFQHHSSEASIVSRKVQWRWCPKGGMEIGHWIVLLPVGPSSSAPSTPARLNRCLLWGGSSMKPWCPLGCPPLAPGCTRSGGPGSGAEAQGGHTLCGRTSPNSEHVHLQELPCSKTLGVSWFRPGTSALALASSRDQPGDPRVGSSPAVGVRHEVGPLGDTWQRKRAGQEWLLVKTHQQTLISFVLIDI